MATTPDPSSHAPTLAASAHAAAEAMNAPTLAADSGVAAEDSRASHAMLGVTDPRYELGGLLGRGGMGDVRLCADARLGRSVALKTMRTHASDALRTRFLREARLQARLEHPSIVPVYDLGTSADGSPFFTMRRLGGDTLEQVIEGLRAGTPEIVARYRPGRLLSDFVRVCQAIAYAHSRGVIHRDLKPSNVILAEFGEVYVLDWGVAKVIGEAEPLDPLEPARAVSLDEAPDQQTAAGSVLGTLGYMPPEQLEGGATRVDHRADVYALGAILFELLTLEPLHPRGSMGELIESTMSGADARASVRAPDREVAPELEAVCVRACAPDPAERHADVRELVAALERFVDGDRDQQRRRVLADEHAERATAELRRAATDVDARSRAAHEAGRALAFDPDHQRALGVLTRLLLEPPERVPPEVTAKLLEADIDSSRSMSRFGAYARFMWLGFLAVFLWMGVRSWLAYGAIVAMLLLAIAASLVYTSDTEQGRRMRSRGAVPTVLVVLNSVMLTLLAGVGGPFVIVPGIAAVSTAMFLLGGARNASLVVVLGCLPILLPFLAEHAGLLPMIEESRGDTFVLHSLLVSFPPLATTVALLSMALATVLMAGVSVASARRRLVASREQQLLLAWHLGQIVPAARATAL